MSKMKSIALFPLLVAGAFAAPACSLPAPKGLVGDGGGATTTVCTITEVSDAGVDSGLAVAVLDKDNPVTPVSCAGVGMNPNAIDRYSQGDTQTAAAIAQATAAIQGNQLSLTDMANQMRGMPYGSLGSEQFNDIQRSLDTSNIRGFRYRDASRAMDLGEDMDGAYPTAAFENAEYVGFSTVFPVSMARGASFDLDLEYAVGEAIGDEMLAAQQTVLLAPCMNVLRHPLWGRAQETYGEDPFHIGRMASAMVVGIQEHIPANAKHFMGYDIENGRSLNNSQMDEQTLREMYGRHFRMVVQDGGVSSVMASYNAVNMKKATENKHILTEVLRNDFGFQGFILSDWWAMPGDTKIQDSSVLKTGALAALDAGLDVELPWALNYGQLESLVQSSAITQNSLEPYVTRILAQKYRFNVDKLTGRIGLKPPTSIYSNSRISCNLNHLALATRAALESTVLLKNANGTLPISPSVKKVAVVGAKVSFVTNAGSGDTPGTVDFAKDVRTGDLGSSRAFFDPKDAVGPFDGIKAAAPSGVTVVAGNTAQDAADADFVVVVAGLTAQDEGEEYTKAGDRASFALDAKQPPATQDLQNGLIRSVAALGKPMVVILEGGSVIDMPWLASVPAVVMAWYPGQRGGEALGDLLWGTVNGVSYNFSAKLPFTWSNLGDYGEFNGGGTTRFDYFLGYRLFDHNNITPIYPFGAGLSYTTFEYRNLQLGCSDMTKGAVLPVYVNVANTGTVPGDEIVMVFVSFPNTTARRPAKELKAFARVTLAPGEEKQVEIPLRLSDLDYFKTDSTGTGGQWVVESGPVQIMVGGSSASLPLTKTVNVTGYTVGSQ